MGSISPLQYSVTIARYEKSYTLRRHSRGVPALLELLQRLLTADCSKTIPNPSPLPQAVAGSSFSAFPYRLPFLGLHASCDCPPDRHRVSCHRPPYKTLRYGPNPRCPIAALVEKWPYKATGPYPFGVSKPPGIVSPPESISLSSIVFGGVPPRQAGASRLRLYRA